MGPYEVARFIAEGGMGAVYEARDTRDGGEGRTVALKLLTSAASQAVDRFEREARLTVALDHPGIVRVFEWSRDGAEAYMAMELLRGSPLVERLAEGPLPLTEAVRVAMEVCAALAHAHAHSVVHRDLTPSNIFLTDAPGAPVKVLDFGVARVVGEAGLTRTGSFLGTLRYVAPEQVTGASSVDARADLWSLGVVLFECLTGRRPFDGEHQAAVLMKVTAGDVPDLGALRPDLPRALVDAVRSALTRDRAARVQSAEELLERLRAVDLAATPAPERRPEGAVERRTVSLVLALGLRDEALARSIAADLGAELTALPGNASHAGSLLAVFGASRSTGDEPSRAARLARALSLLARSVTATTGRATTSGGGVSGEVIDAAFALAPPEGIALDEVTRTADRDAATATTGAADTLHDASAATPFVGRAAELDQLVRQVTAADETGVVSTTVVSGAPGHGKSRLLVEAVARVRQAVDGVTVVTVRGDPLRESVPYAALREAMAAVVGDDLVRPLALGEDGDAQRLRDRARQCVLSVLQGLVERGPVLVAVDDAQWLDAATRAALRHACESGEFLPVALWFFCHPQAEDALTQVRAPSAEASRRSFTLQPLERVDAARILAAVAPDAPEGLLDRAGVVPLFVEEFARLWNTRRNDSWQTLPASIDLVYQSQLDQLGDAPRDFLKRAAVFGRTFWAEGVASLGAGGVDPRRMGALLTPRPTGRFDGVKEFVFRSGLLQEVAAGLWTDDERAQLHRLAGTWLEGRGADPLEVAHHFERAGDTGRAASMLCLAVERAAGVSDAATTASLAARALSLTDDPTLRWRALVARDRGLQLDGDRTLQREGLDAIDALAPVLGLAAMAEAAWRRCYLLRITGDVAAAVEQGEHACALALGADTPRWSAAALNDLALLHADAGRFEEAIRCAEEAVEVAESLGDPWWRARTAAALAYAVNECGDATRALALYQRAAAGFHEAGDARVEGLALANAAYTLSRLGHVGDAIERFDDVIRRCRAVGNLRTTSMAHANRATLLRMQGRLDESATELATAESLAARIGHPRIVAAARTERVYLALARDGSDDFAALGPACLDAATRAGSAQLLDAARATALRALARTGSAAAALYQTVADAARGASAEGRVELLAALADHDGWTGPHRDALTAALDAAVEAIHPDDAVGCRAALLRRFAVPSSFVC